MRVLHLLSQRPGRTGSGVTLDALVREAAAAGWTQEVAVGTPADDPAPEVGGLDPEQVHPLRFGTAELPFAVPGMSDVMPYESTRWRDMTAEQLDAYRHAWRRHVGWIVARFRPDVIHVHHAWILASIVKDVAPDVPVVVQGHATGLRQMALCPHLTDEVRQGLVRNERFLALTHEHARRTVEALGVDIGRITVVGAGYPERLFDAPRHETPQGSVLYAGKYSRAKGLPWLLDAVERLDGVTLHVAGTGRGAEAEAIGARMEGMAPRVVLHGQLDQPALAALMRACAVFVLPSFYEGLPLVVVEAIASGCRVVCTDLPAVREDLVPCLGEAIDLVPLPRLHGADEPKPEDLPRFVEDLAGALDRACTKQSAVPCLPLTDFTWNAVFGRVERVWKDVARA